MKDVLTAFLDALDAELTKHAAEGERLDLYLVGRGALVLRYGLNVTTRDVDVVQDHRPLEQKARELFARDGQRARELGLYLDLVPQGLPPLPHWFRKRSQEVTGGWAVIRPRQLEIHDLAATKLKAFRAKDREDLQFLCDRQELDPAGLSAALEAAFSWSLDKDGDDDRDTAFANLAKVIAYIEGESASL